MMFVLIAPAKAVSAPVERREPTNRPRAILQFDVKDSSPFTLVKAPNPALAASGTGIAYHDSYI
jgi:hypothetical protein